jgi:hypothetical protein
VETSSKRTPHPSDLRYFYARATDFDGRECASIQDPQGETCARSLRAVSTLPAALLGDSLRGSKSKEVIMTNPIETITVESLPVISYQNVRVITSDLLAQLYKTDVKNIQMNFTRNAGRFEPDKHYFKLEGETVRQFKRLHKPTVRGTWGQVFH